MTTYKPQSSLIKGLWIFAGIFLLAFLFIGLTSETSTSESLIKGMLILTALLLIFPIMGTFFTRIRIDNERIKALTWISRKDISISNIKSLSFKKSLVGLLTDIRVSYMDEKGRDKEKIIGTLEAYGDKNVSKILRDLKQQNPQINFDQKGEQLLRTINVQQ